MTHVDAIFNLYNALVLFGGSFCAFILWLCYRKTHSRPLLNSIPGIFTSLGLLGTFMSIVLTLGGIKDEDFSTIKEQSKTEVVVSKGMSAEQLVDAENGMKSVESTGNQTTTDTTITIINNLVPAFTSSIIGLVLALISTIVCKIKFSLEDKEIDQKIGKKSPEECLYQLTEKTNMIVAVLQAQEEETKLFHQQLKSNIVEQNSILQKFIAGFVEKMGDIFDNMKSSIATQVESIGNEQMKKAEGIIVTISEQLGSLTTHMLDSQKESVKQLVEKTNSQLENMAQSVASQYDIIQKNASENMATMSALKEQYVRSNEDMLQHASEMNKQVSDDMRHSLQGFVGDIKESVSNECQVLHSAIESNVTSLTMAYDFLKDRLAQITHDYEQAGLAFDNAVTNSHRQNEKTENAIKKANESLELLSETNARMSELLEAFNSRQDNIETLVSHINEMGTAIATLQKIETQLKRLNK